MKIIKRILKWATGIILIALIVWFEIAYWTSTNDCGLYSTAPGNPMKAVVYCDYGVPNLKFQEIEKPTPADDQLLVRVRAASVNPLDWHFIEGTPYVMRAMGVGLRKPKALISPARWKPLAKTSRGSNRVTRYLAGEQGPLPNMYPSASLEQWP